MLHLVTAELQVCTATRSPCEDQALPLSWAPPSSAEGGKSPQGQPCCRLQWLRLSTFSAAGRLTEFFREPRHHQMPAEEQRSGGMRSGAHEGLMCPLERGVRGIETSGSGYLQEQIRGGRKGRAERQGLGHDRTRRHARRVSRHLQMPGRSWRAGKAIAAMESP